MSSFNVVEMIDGNVDYKVMDDIQFGVLLDEFYEVYVGGESREDSSIVWGGDSFVKLTFDNECWYEVNKINC